MTFCVRKKQTVYKLYGDYADSFPEVKDISARETMTLMKTKRVVFVDVRKPQEQKVSMLRRIVTDMSRKQLQEDLEKYTAYTLELGATDAKIIRSEDVVVEYRIIAKCLVPRCPVSGTNVNCPPHALDPEKIRRMLEEFQWGIFFKLDAPYDNSVAPNRESKLRNLEILGRLEAKAYYDGYYLAVGFGGASCKTTLCPDQDCPVLTDGQSCRHPLRGRPSMHAVGMDAYRMAAQVGWEIYPIGRQTQPSDVPFISHLGLILIY